MLEKSNKGFDRRLARKVGGVPDDCDVCWAIISVSRARTEALNASPRLNKFYLESWLSSKRFKVLQ